MGTRNEAAVKFILDSKLRSRFDAGFVELAQLIRKHGTDEEKAAVERFFPNNKQWDVIGAYRVKDYLCKLLKRDPFMRGAWIFAFPSHDIWEVRIVHSLEDVVRNAVRAAIKAKNDALDAQAKYIHERKEAKARKNAPPLLVETPKTAPPKTPPHSKSECVFCYDNQPVFGYLHNDTVHCAVCEICSSKAKGVKTCPVCRSEFTAFVKVFGTD